MLQIKVCVGGLLGNGRAVPWQRRASRCRSAKCFQISKRNQAHAKRALVDTTVQRQEAFAVFQCQFTIDTSLATNHSNRVSKQRSSSQPVRLLCELILTRFHQHLSMFVLSGRSSSCRYSPSSMFRTSTMPEIQIAVSKCFRALRVFFCQCLRWLGAVGNRCGFLLSSRTLVDFIFLFFPLMKVCAGCVFVC